MLDHQQDYKQEPSRRERMVQLIPLGLMILALTVMSIAIIGQAYAANETTNETTVIINPSTESTIGFSINTLLWILFGLLLIASLIFYTKVPGIPIVFGFYGVIFGIILLGSFGFWVTLIIEAISVLVAIPATIGLFN